MQVKRDETVPLTLSVSDENGGVTGLTATVAVRRGETLNSYLDFADLTFKTSGWTTKNQAMAAVGGGVYAAVSALALGSLINLPAGTRFLVAEYTVTGAVDGVTSEVLVLETTAAEVSELLGIAKNRLEINFTTQKLELYDEAGTTVIQRWPLATKNGEPVVTKPGVQTKRGVPEL